MPSLEGGSPLARARAAAALSGVTRLADVTHLDRLGVPVFQAIRPWSRALSVHQGKGLDADEARLGALMEAVESFQAETFAGEEINCAFWSLPADERAPKLSDFAGDRRRPPPAAEPVGWTSARTVIGDRRLWVPVDVVSLDLTRDPSSRFDRTSAGLAAHFDHEAACRSALLEVIERDAVSRWRGLDIVARTNSGVDLDTIPFAWWRCLQGRLAEAGLMAAAYVAPAVIDAPVFVWELIEPAAGALGRGAVFGSACRTDPEDALRAALLEAVQSRLTEIVGARDDIPLPPDRPVEPGPFGFGLPPANGMRQAAWSDIAGEFGGGERCAEDLARALAAAGYGPAAIVDLSPSDGGAAVVKAVAPGLAAGRRSRRAPGARS